MLRRAAGQTFAFSIPELLACLVGISFLAVACLAALPREHAEKAACANNLRQLGVAAFSYSDENDGAFPPRAISNWVVRLKPYYEKDSVAQCPAKRSIEASPHSYLMNGFNDYLQMAYGSPVSSLPIKEEELPLPGETVLFGEKEPLSFHAYMDFYFGDDLMDLDVSRHLGLERTRSGGSNHTFADGSARFLPYAAALMPVNMWAVLPEYRQGVLVP